MDSLRADRVATGVVWAVAALITATFVWLLGDLLWHGASRLSWDFLFTLPRSSGREGGLLSVLAATGLILFVCMAVSLPLGVGTAVLLAEFAGEGGFGRVVRRSLDVLAGVPSIVFGLFGNALACMVLPILIRATEEGLLSAPNEYRLSAAALGISRSSTLFRLLLPAAVPGLMVGFILGLGRAIAENA